MRRVPCLLRRLIRTFRIHRPDEELAVELDSHIGLLVDEYQRRGMGAAESRRAAMLRFGSLQTAKEACREERGFTGLADLARDLGYAFRGMLANPGFTLVVVATLALGIGANTAMFSVVDSILLRPLPFRDPAGLARIWGDLVRHQASLVVMRDESRAAEYGAFADNAEFNLTGQGEPQRATGSVVSAGLFSILGQKPLLGRIFQPGEDAPGNDRLVILSYAFWQSHFRADPGIVGHSITLDEIDRRVVGIMPPEFHFPNAQTAVWVPTHIDPRNIGVYWWVANLNIVGRLRPGFTQEQAQTELRTLVPKIRDSFSWKMWPDSGMKARVLSLGGNPDLWSADAAAGAGRSGRARAVDRLRQLWRICCWPAAHPRHKEISVRIALGAGRFRILRQLLTESMLLAAIGGAFGLAIAFTAGGLFRRVLRAELAQLADRGVDIRVLGFTAALALATGFLFGMLPGLRLWKAGVQGALQSESRAIAGARMPQRISTALVAFEIAVGVVVVIGAGLLARSFLQLIDVNPGFRSAGTLTALVTPNPSLCRAPARCVAFYHDLLERARLLPGVREAAAVNPIPLTGDFNGGAMELDGHPVPPGHSAPSFWTTAVTPGYLAAMDIPVLRGRAFDGSDRQGTELVALVTAATARRWWPGENPIGKHLRFVAEKAVRTVVGVVGDTREVALDGDPDWLDGHFYLPYDQYAINLTPAMGIVLRTAGSPLLQSQPLRRLVAQLRPDVPVTQIRTLDEVISNSVHTPRSTMWLLFSFAALALVLSSVGLYAVVAHLVAQKTRVIGIRMALGAQAWDILHDVMGRSLGVTSAGLAAGIAGSWLATKVLCSLLFQTAPHDAVTFIVTPLVLIFVALIATWAPARKAAHVDPAVTLRYE